MNEPLIKDTFCSYCGSQFADGTLYPKKCQLCKQETYSNPIPVATTLIPVHSKHKSQSLGLLLVQRLTEPHIGGWAFPGGYIVSEETWQEGASREVFEEVNIKLDPCHISLHSVVSTRTLVIFAYYKHSILWEDIQFIPNEEVSEIRMVTSFEELCFPSHTDILKKYFNRFIGKDE